jgi:hypothetical protein
LSDENTSSLSSNAIIKKSRMFGISLDFSIKNNFVLIKILRKKVQTLRKSRHFPIIFQSNFDFFSTKVDVRLFSFNFERAIFRKCLDFWGFGQNTLMSEHSEIQTFSKYCSIKIEWK